MSSFSFHYLLEQHILTIKNAKYKGSIKFKVINKYEDQEVFFIISKCAY